MAGAAGFSGRAANVQLGNGGTFSVALNDAIFATPGSANISGTFTLLTPSVPEPATWATMPSASA